MTPEIFIKICVYGLFGVFGLCVGSFLNVLIYRTPREMSLSKPASHCTSCGYHLRWYDNIPVLSYLILCGKCRKCKTHISPRYMIVEIANALFWLLAAFLFWDISPVYAVTSAIASSSLICIFFIDLEHLLIFNRFTFVVAICGVVAIFTDDGALWQDHIIGAVAGGGIFFAIYYGAIAVLNKEGLLRQSL